ncbi:MAG: TetR family transcriptional regulator [Pseudonocardia sp.]|nr:TetR family transcriptional regulator [Pseudonocardia sp.]
MATRRGSREERRAEIVRVAAAVFAQHGYGAATLQEIADRLAVTKTSLYRHVQGKEELLGAIVGEALGDGRAILERYRQAEGPVLERLRGVVADHVRHFVRNLDVTTVYLHEMHRLPTTLRERFDHDGMDYQRSMRDLVQEGRSAGVVRSELDPGLVALQILGSITWMYRWYRPGGRLDPDAIADQLAEVMVNGLAVPQGGTSLGRRPRKRVSGRPPAGALDSAEGAGGARLRRSEVVEVAASVFAARGYGGASLQEIADRLGILKGSLYHYIDAKDDLLLEVVQRTYDGGYSRLRQHVEMPGDVPDRLRNLITDQVMFFVNNVTPTSVYLHESHRLPDAVGTRLRRAGPGYHESIRSLFDEGRRAGTIRADMDPGLAALQVLGSLNWMYRWYHPGGRLMPARIADQLADVVLHGVAAPAEADSTDRTAQ